MSRTNDRKKKEDRRLARDEARELFRNRDYVASTSSGSAKTDADYIDGAGWETVGRWLRSLGDDPVPSVITGREFELC